MIPLPYGSDVDWYRNVEAAGHCTISWKGNDYECDLIFVAVVALVAFVAVVAIVAIVSMM